MTTSDPNKIQQRDFESNISHQIRYLTGVADSVGYVILSAELMKQVADSHAWLERRYDSYRAEERHRKEMEKKRKARMKATK